MEYEIWRYGRFELSTGRASFADLNWDGFCALRGWLLAMEAGAVSRATRGRGRGEGGRAEARCPPTTTRSRRAGWP